MTGYANIIKHTLKVEKEIALKKDKLDPFIKKMEKSPFLRLLALLIVTLSLSTLKYFRTTQYSQVQRNVPENVNIRNL